MKLDHSPWGRPDHQKEIVPGIVELSTPSHGGIWISDERRADMPACIRGLATFAGGNWYEEDCDWALVVASFPEYFDARACWYAVRSLRGGWGGRLTMDAAALYFATDPAGKRAAEKAATWTPAAEAAAA